MGSEVTQGVLGGIIVVVVVGLFKGGIGEEYVNTLGFSTKSYPHEAYMGLKMPLQSDWKYLQKAVLGVRYFMGSVDQGMAEDVLPMFMG